MLRSNTIEDVVTFNKIPDDTNYTIEMDQRKKSIIRQQKTVINCVQRQVLKEGQPQTRQDHKQQEMMEPTLLITV